VIMTSNIGSHHLLDGIDSSGEITAQARGLVMQELRSHFRPEFLNRVDDIVLFAPLSLKEIERIVELQVDDVRRRLAERRVTLELTDAARASIAQSAYDPVYGARPLKRFIQHEVETRVGRALLSGEILPGATITVDVVDGELDVRWENAAEQPQAPTEEVGAPA
jgi:ATP-dependent Clp protease ATP-binding subunit ClpB